VGRRTSQAPPAQGAKEERMGGRRGREGGGGDEEARGDEQHSRNFKKNQQRSGGGGEGNLLVRVAGGAGCRSVSACQNLPHPGDLPRGMALRLWLAGLGRA
jgi:hypothetical protein